MPYWYNYPRGYVKSDPGAAMNKASGQRKPASISWLAVFNTLLLAITVCVVVIWLAFLARALMPGKSEELPDFASLQLSDSMTIQQVAAQANPFLPGEQELAGKLAAKALNLQPGTPPGQTLAELGIPATDAEQKLVKALALRAERNSKDFFRIILKFALWIALLPLPVILLMRRKLTPVWRYSLLGFSIAVFGVWLGSDPNPMGTVKDAIVLYGQTGALFPPRLIALTVFLLLVIIANKYICSWGCQFGTLQELMYRLNRRGLPQRGALPLLRIPFKVSNTIRIVVFVALTVAAVAWGFDLLGPIDPFRVFKPAVLGWLGGGFLAVLLIAALFIYRPWCSLLCPFGLAGWLVERLSILRVRVDYSACTACRACIKACPSEAMEGLLTGRGMPQDCFSCGDCLAACPTSAVKYTYAKGVKRSDKRTEILAKLRKGSN